MCRKCLGRYHFNCPDELLQKTNKNQLTINCGTAKAKCRFDASRVKIAVQQELNAIRDKIFAVCDAFGRLLEDEDEFMMNLKEVSKIAQKKDKLDVAFQTDGSLKIEPREWTQESWDAAAMKLETMLHTTVNREFNAILGRAVFNMYDQFDEFLLPITVKQETVDAVSASKRAFEMACGQVLQNMHPFDFREYFEHVLNAERPVSLVQSQNLNEALTRGVSDAVDDALRTGPKSLEDLTRIVRTEATRHVNFNVGVDLVVNAAPAPFQARGFMAKELDVKNVTLTVRELIPEPQQPVGFFNRNNVNNFVPQRPRVQPQLRLPPPANDQAQANPVPNFFAQLANQN